MRIRRSVCCFASLGVLALAASSHAQVTAYFGADDGIIRTSVVGSGTASVAYDTGGTVEDVEVDAAAGKMYWASSIDFDFTFRSDLDGANQETIGGGLNGNNHGVALDLEAGKVYWTQPFTSARIQRADLDGSNLETVVQAADATPLVVPYGVAIRQATGQLYWAEGGGSNLLRTSDLDGANIATLLTSSGSPRAVALNERDGFVYWGNTATSSIFSAPIGGGAITTLVPTTAGTPEDIEVDLVHDKLYWSTSDGLQRADLDGTGVETVLGGQTGVNGFDLIVTAPVPALPWPAAVAAFALISAALRARRLTAGTRG